MGKRVKDHAVKHWIYDMLCNELWLHIFRLALNDTRDFNQTWTSMRLVSKTWKSMVAIDNLLPFHDSAITRHAFLIAVRLDDRSLVETFIQKRLIDPTMDDSIAIREAIRWNKFKVFQELSNYLDWDDIKYIQLAVKSGSANIILEVVKSEDSLYYPVGNKRQTRNILITLIRNGNYDACNMLIQYCINQRQSNPRLYRFLCQSIAYPLFLRTCSKRGYTGLLKTVLPIRLPILDYGPYDNDAKLMKTCLGDAIKHANIDTVRYFLSEFEWKQSDIYNGVNLCAEYDHIDTMKILLEYARRKNMELNIQRLLDTASSNRNLRTILILLKEPNVIVSEDNLLNAVKYGNRDIVNELIKTSKIKNCDKVGMTAAQYERYEIVTDLLSDKNLNHDGIDLIDYHKIITYAAHYGYFHLVMELLENQNLDLDGLDFDEILIYACLKSADADIIEKLLTRYNANPNAREALTHACTRGNIDAVKKLIHHPEINEATIRQALHQVVKIDDLDILSTLLSSPLISKDEYPLMIGMAASRIPNACMFDLLRRLWEDNVNVPLHWRFFYLIYHMTYDVNDLCEFPNLDIRKPPSHHMILHLKLCKLTHESASDICICEKIRFSIDGKTEFSLQSVIRKLINDLSHENLPDHLSSFMTRNLFDAIKISFFKLCNLDDYYSTEDLYFSDDDIEM